MVIYTTVIELPEKFAKVLNPEHIWPYVLALFTFFMAWDEILKRSKMLVEWRVMRPTLCLVVSTFSFYILLAGHYLVFYDSDMPFADLYWFAAPAWLLGMGIGYFIDSVALPPLTEEEINSLVPEEKIAYLRDLKIELIWTEVFQGREFRKFVEQRRASVRKTSEPEQTPKDY